MKASELCLWIEQFSGDRTPYSILETIRSAHWQAEREGIEVTPDDIAPLALRAAMRRKQMGEQIEAAVEAAEETLAKLKADPNCLTGQEVADSLTKAIRAMGPALST